MKKRDKKGGYYFMQKRKMIICTVVVLGILAGCTKIDTDQNLSEMEMKNSIEIDNTKEQSEKEESAIKEIKEDEMETSFTEQETRELSSKELQDFTYYINQWDNNGFLLSQYAAPEEVDIEEVLYNGAGMENVSMTEEEASTYLNAKEGLTIETDCTKLTTQQIDDFLNRKMGISFADVTKELSWIYLQEYDCFVSQHGDTNFAAFTCAKGTQIGEDTYILNCAANDGYISDCEVELRKVGNDYQFVSNRFKNEIQNAKDIWVIQDQTFQVNLEEWGDVMFTSYAPDTSVNMFNDVTFALVKNGDTIFEFPGMEENNIRGTSIFEGIKAVGFKDYNGDGRKEIIIINQYASSTGNDVAQWFDEVRVYCRRGDEQEFTLDMNASDYLNRNHITGSIAEVVQNLPLSNE